jgi:hypothetical protein
LPVSQHVGTIRNIAGLGYGTFIRRQQLALVSLARRDEALDAVGSAIGSVPLFSAEASAFDFIKDKTGSEPSCIAGPLGAS